MWKRQNIRWTALSSNMLAIIDCWLLTVTLHYLSFLYNNYQTWTIKLNSNIGSSQSDIVTSRFEIGSVLWCLLMRLLISPQSQSFCLSGLMLTDTHRSTRLCHCLASQMTREPMTNSQFTSIPREPGKQQNTVPSRASYLRTFTDIKGSLWVIRYIFQHHFYLKYLGRSVYYYTVLWNRLHISVLSFFPHYGVSHYSL